MVDSDPQASLMLKEIIDDFLGCDYINKLEHFQAT